MKKYTILLLFSFSCIGNSFGQQKETENNGVTFGLKAGYTQYNIYGKDQATLSPEGSTKALNSFYIGAEVNTKFSKYFGLKHSISVLQKGAIVKRTHEADNTGYESKYKNLYLDIAPISPTFHFHGFQIYAGPYVGVLIHSSIQYKNENGQLITDKSLYGDATQEGNYSQKIDAGIVAGIDYVFKNGITIGAQFTQGFVPLIENTNSTNRQSKIYNKGFSFTIGYTFGS